MKRLRAAIERFLDWRNDPLRFDESQAPPSSYFRELRKDGWDRW
jgi:hypothetical protein